jgi:hypothetical protein
LTAICVVDGTGRIIKETRTASEPEALVTALKKLGLPLERVGLEACSLTAWLHDGRCHVVERSRNEPRTGPYQVATPAALRHASNASVRKRR